MRRGARALKQLLAQSEACIAVRGGKRVYIETARASNINRRADFTSLAGIEEAILEDFYAPGDGSDLCESVITNKPGFEKPGFYDV